ncbi:MAG: type II secretion system protein [Rubritalea sp.]|uniref:type II secretion system protein n=1 Tax=Rubritalea sp. TaxID=2109375 RepID=UPI003241F8DD
MKLNKNISKSPKGVTLIELSVVIAVILVLISVLFIGAGYYRDSSNNAACQITQSSIRKAAESYLNVNTQEVTALSGVSDIVGEGLPFATAPECPTKGSLTLTATGGVVTQMECSEHDNQL